jgi:diacylglycerol kinase family enzyme
LRFALSDGSIIEDKFLFGAISNSTSVGGILTLAPDRVDMADGKLELLLIRAPRNLLELGECVRALQQKTYNCEMITFLSTESLTVRAPEALCWTIDGEQGPGHAETDVSCLHHAIQVITK